MSKLNSASVVKAPPVTDPPGHVRGALQPAPFRRLPVAAEITVGFVEILAGGVDERRHAQDLRVRRRKLLGFLDGAGRRLQVLRVVGCGGKSLQQHRFLRREQQSIGERVLGLAEPLVVEIDVPQLVDGPVVGRIVLERQPVTDGGILFLARIAGRGPQVIGQAVQVMQLRVGRVELQGPVEAFLSGDVVAILQRLQPGADERIAQARGLLAVQRAGQVAAGKRARLFLRLAGGARRQHQHDQHHGCFTSEFHGHSPPHCIIRIPEFPYLLDIIPIAPQEKNYVQNLLPKGLTMAPSVLAGMVGA